MLIFSFPACKSITSKSSGVGHTKSASAASPSRVIFVSFGIFWRGPFGRLTYSVVRVAVSESVFFSSRFWLSFNFFSSAASFYRLASSQLSSATGACSTYSALTLFLCSSVLNFGVSLPPLICEACPLSTSDRSTSDDFSSSRFFVS